jgi:integrase
MAGLMLLSGLRSAEVLALRVSDVDIPRGWALVTGEGDKERRVPVDAEVAGLIQTYPARRAPGCRRGRHGHRPAVRGGQGAEPGAAADR